MEALIKFTIFVKFLRDRGQVSLMPDLRIFLFWLEFFVALSLCLAVKIRGSAQLNDNSADDNTGFLWPLRVFESLGEMIIAIFKALKFYENHN